MAAKNSPPSVVPSTIDMAGNQGRNTAKPISIKVASRKSGVDNATRESTDSAWSANSGSSWTDRIRGIRANASCRSHAELDEAEDLDEGNPMELGAQYRDLRARLKNLSVLGGCCGSTPAHVAAIAAAVAD